MERTHPRNMLTSSKEFSGESVINLGRRSPYPTEPTLRDVGVHLLHVFGIAAIFFGGAGAIAAVFNYADPIRAARPVGQMKPPYHLKCD